MTKRKPYTHINYAQRLKFEALHRAGCSMREIAAQLGIHLSTVYAEYKRGAYQHLNTNYTYETRYSADKAEADHQLKSTAKGAPLKIGKNYEAAKFIEDKIKNEKYSPAAVCALLKRPEYAYLGVTFCRVTLYKYIEDGNIFANLTNKDLPEKSKRKRKYNKVRAKTQPKGRSIETRPENINMRNSFGHWEMDTILSSRKSTARLLVLSERMTRYELIYKIPDGTAQSVARVLDKIEKKTGSDFPKIFRSITVDNGNEFANSQRLSQSIINANCKRTEIYYCHPYCASERGTNENINRMIRRFFPKGTNFKRITSQHIKSIERWINTYPRQILNFLSAEQCAPWMANYFG